MCNNMVISWLHNNVSDSIKKSILFVTYAYEIWKHLESRFNLTNGSRKYKLNKYLLAMRQNGMTIVEYYTSMSSVWEELNSMNVLPGITTTSPEIVVMLKAIETQREESNLFQFLNGLNEQLGPQVVNCLC